jgi:hypothetical protein
MSADEKNEGAGAGSRAQDAGGRGPKGKTQPSASHAGGESFRIGTKNDIRGAGGKKARGKSKPPDTLRDGTR